MKETGNERAWRRFPHYSTIGYVPAQDSGKGMHRGLSINKSAGGLCIYVFQPLNEGENIQITDDSLDGLVGYEGTVMWVKQINKEMYKVGLNINKTT